MGEYYKSQGVTSVAIYGAFIPNPMHVYRVAGVIAGLGDTYGGTDDMNGMIGQIFQDQNVDLSKVSGDVDVVAYLVATDSASFDQYYVSDSGDSPIYDKATLDTIIGSSVTFDDVKSLVESK
jgi:hypothetical protein